MKPVVVYVHDGIDPQPLAMMEAFAQGAGAEVRAASDYVPCEVAVIFGLIKWQWTTEPWPVSRIAGRGHTTNMAGLRPLLGEPYKHELSRQKAMLLTKHRGQVLVMERGFIQREDFWAIGWNGIAGRADHRSWNVPGDRFASFHHTFPPLGGEGIVVMGQVPWDVSVQDTDHVQWVQDRVKVALKHGHEVIFRPHPLAVRRGVDYRVDCEIDTGPLADTLRDRAVVSTFNSTSGVDALLANRLVEYEDAGSMVAGWTVRGIQRTLERIAYAQWTIEEMRAGLPWRHLNAL